MKRVRARLTAIALTASLGAAVMGTIGAPAQALSNPPIPVLTPTPAPISSHPFSGAPGNAIDVEGLGSVPGDNSMWVADDNGDRIWEIDPATGAYKTQLRGGVSGTAFLTATQVGTGLTCGDALEPGIVGDTAAYECLSRTDDLESVVYDPDADVLYATSGNCCTAGLPPGYPYHPTVWKLTRDGSGHFTPTSWQALPEGEDLTAGGWRPGAGIYVGKSNTIKSYNFNTNTLTTVKSGLVSNIVGITFTGPNTAFITTATPNTASGRTTADSDSTIRRFDISGSTWTANPTWTFPLVNTGMIDARDLAIVNDTFYVSDGYDSRPGGDHPIYVYNLTGAPAPTASFAAVPTTGRAPFTVQFLDTSTPVAPAVGAPTSWDWDFGDGSAHATAQHPAHAYTTAGTYTATLIASNAAGASQPATQKITVKPATDLPGGYTLDGFGGLHAFRVGTGPQPPATSGGGYWQGWDIARGLAVLSDGSGGYMLDGFGGLHKVRIGGGANPKSVTGSAYWQGWDIARGVALLPNKKGGYVVDAYGGVHPFATGSNSAPPAIRGAPYWLGRDMARGLTIMPDGKGGYVVDRYGKLHPFKIGTGGTKPPAGNNVFTSTTVSVQGVSLLSDGTGGLTVDGNGGLHGFGVGVNAKPPATSGAASWPGWDIARDVALLPG